MLNHKFTLRETLLLLVAAFLALGIFYYQVVVKNYNEAKELYNTSGIAEELTILQAKVAKKQSMEDYLSKHSNDSYGEIAVYNNLSNEISALANIFDGKVDNVSISWSEPTLDGTIVRRNASISFKTNNYALTKNLVSNINSLKYRVIITNLSITSDNKENLSTSSSISVNMNLTFFETTVGATNTSGLTIVEQ